ncbi:MarR family transcriptional regulator [Brevibacillus choshinensis]|uniref:MarR family transcriptional regulator n=1 Tax=Brevibacillus choshinensis TaxID=54911 RepID=A0ABR5N3C7_BRECH|nr:MarR family transcriptional regulator [Brevibacillus choshinensis]KQL44997.1 MarR family transcriptional regulator [Brevibacillus choshinensis]
MKQDPLIQEIIGLFGKIQKRFETEDDEERKWLVENCKNPVIVDLLKEMTVMELHVLDAIGRFEPVNGITISKQFSIPKGSVSKITRRMLARKLIETEYLPNNKKEILFRITPLGKELFDLHRALHERIEYGVTTFLQKYKPEELSVLVRMLVDAETASWVYPELPKEEGK